MHEHGIAGGFGTLAFPDIVEIRNLFLTIWYDKVQSSHLLFIDDDMGFEPQLILDMLALNKPLVGALCPKRKLPIEFAGRAKAGECRIVNGHMEVDGVGGAIMLIRRDCVDAIIKANPDVIDTKSIAGHAAKVLLDEHGCDRMIKAFNKIWRDGEEFSEDLSFCLRWKEAAPAEYQGPDGKGEVWANIAHMISHVGQHEFQGRYLDLIKDQITQAPKEPLPMEVVAQMQAAE